MKSFKLFFLLLVVIVQQIVFAQTGKVRNVIVMIPDGTSTSVLSLSRWYQGYKESSIKNLPKLAIDSWVCGLVRTHSSNAPIGDSAPTSSWYATGEASRAGYIAMYPPKDEANDLVDIDDTKKYQPLLTVLEASKLSGKKTGLVFTCQFPHATPADFSAHWYDRSNYNLIAKQMVYNDIDVLFGGGSKYLTSEEASYLVKQKYDTIEDDIGRFRSLKETGNTKAWALFGDNDMPYDFDRDKLTTPSLAEMTGKAIRILSKNEKGFFLMVEGSKVDWAAHANDPIGVVSEFLAFDKAVDTVINFARNNKESETIVVILPDHGNSAISVGNSNSNGVYTKLSAKQLFEPLVDYNFTSVGSAAILCEGFKPDSVFIIERFKKINSSLILSSEDIQKIIEIYQKYKNNDEKFRDKITAFILKLMTEKSYIGFTTKGHTGEDVFLAIYDAENNNPRGVVRSEEINKYLCKSLGFIDKDGNTTLKDSTAKYFSKHDDVFKNCNITMLKNDSIYLWNDYVKTFNSISKSKGNELMYSKSKNKNYVEKNKDIVLIVKKGKNVLEIPAYENNYYLNGKQGKLESVVIYVDKNETFYLPKQLLRVLEN